MSRRIEKLGGSVASSDLESIPKQASPNLPYPSTYNTLVKANDVVKQYGSVYKTTGGGVSQKKAYSFVRKFLDNRVLDLYLKYLGITTLTPTTLVPIALIFGQRAFQKAFRHMKKQEQRGGKIPVVDNELVGTYLKLAGLTQLTFGLNTLVPLGLAMAIWQAFTKRQQRGGHVGRLLTGASVPPGYLQLGRMYWNGQDVQNNLASPLSAAQQLSRPMSYINHELQIPCQGDSCATAGLPTPPKLDILKTDVAGIGNTTPDTSNVLAVKPLNQELIQSEDHYKQITGSQSGLYLDGTASSLVMRNQMAGGSSCGSASETVSSPLVGPPTMADSFDVSASQFSGGGIGGPTTHVRRSRASRLSGRKRYARAKQASPRGLSRPSPRRRSTRHSPHRRPVRPSPRRRSSRHSPHRRPVRTSPRRRSSRHSPHRRSTSHSPHRRSTRHYRRRSPSHSPHRHSRRHSSHRHSPHHRHSKHHSRRRSVTPSPTRRYRTGLIVSPRRRYRTGLKVSPRRRSPVSRTTVTSRTSPTSRTTRSTATSRTSPTSRTTRSSVTSRTSPTSRTTRSTATSRTSPTSRTTRSTVTSRTSPTSRTTRSTVTSRTSPTSRTTRSTATSRTSPTSRTTRSTATSRTSSTSRTSQSSASSKSTSTSKRFGGSINFY